MTSQLANRDCELRKVMTSQLANRDCELRIEWPRVELTTAQATPSVGRIRVTALLLAAERQGLSVSLSMRGYSVSRKDGI